MEPALTGLRLLSVLACLGALRLSWHPALAGRARLNLALGVDKDCNLATGDADGVDRLATIRAEIDVTTDARSGDD